MKIIFAAAISLFILSTFSCTHGVYKTEIASENMNLISDDVTGRCEDKCEVESCWLETKTLTVCSVQFSSLDNVGQKRVLTTSSAALKDKGLTVGYCGHDASNSKTVGSVFRTSGQGGFVGASSGTGSPFASGSANSTLVHEIFPSAVTAADEKAMAQACHSRPDDH